MAEASTKKHTPNKALAIREPYDRAKLGKWESRCLSNSCSVATCALLALTLGAAPVLSQVSITLLPAALPSQPLRRKDSHFFFRGPRPPPVLSLSCLCQRGWLSGRGEQATGPPCWLSPSSLKTSFWKADAPCRAEGHCFPGERGNWNALVCH